MDVKKVSNFESMVKPEGVGAKTQPQGTGPSFLDTLNSLQSGFGPQVGGRPTNGPVGNKPANGPVGKMPTSGPVGKIPTGPQTAPDVSGVKFSNHAVERMQTRGISFNQADLQRLNEAVGRAAAKGSKDTLVLMNDSALIVSVKNKTVVTVMDKTALKENVFTNIDSTIVM